MVKKLIFIFFAFLSIYASAQRKVQHGQATYYSRRSTGARTASGERLHHDSLTCAHRNHPFGTLLRVTNMKNGKSTVVRVTDRGPFGRGKVIDLSYRAAREIGMLSSGIATVKVEVIEKKQDKGIPYRTNEEVSLPKYEFELADFKPEKIQVPRKPLHK